MQERGCFASLDFFICTAFHCFINRPVDECGGAFVHGGSVFLDDCALVSSHADFHLYKFIYVFLVGPFTGFCETSICAFFAIHLFALRFTFNKCIDLYYHICKHEANLIKNYRIENFIEYTDGAGPLTKMNTDFTLNSWIASNCLKMEH